MNSMATTERLRRLLIVIPWIVERDGPLIDDVVNRFNYDRKQLIADLEEIVFYVGVHPFTPDCLIEVQFSDDRVWIRYAEWFLRPIRLSKTEIVALHAAGTTVRKLIGDSVKTELELGPLERALTKLSGCVNGLEDVLEVRLGVNGDLLLAIREAIQKRKVIQFEYHSFYKDHLSYRLVEPHELYADKGQWYCSGICRNAEGLRTFRLDRIRKWQLTEREFGGKNENISDLEGVLIDGELPEVVLEVNSNAHWIIDEYPHNEVKSIDEKFLVRLPVASKGWLERLLLRLGEDASIVHTPDGFESNVGSLAARRILTRYKNMERLRETDAKS